MVTFLSGYRLLRLSYPVLLTQSSVQTSRQKPPFYDPMNNHPLKRQRDHEADSTGPPSKQQRGPATLLASPWQLTRIRDLPDELNRDAISLRDIVGDTLVRECWHFNFLHDINFLMDVFDPAIRHAVDVHIVHGFWKSDDVRRLVLAQDATQFPNVHLHVAPMPEMFGTHHSKMMVLFRRDDTAQVVIHTANMIPKDWTNMTNAVWRSPLLPRLSAAHESSSSVGESFKAALLAYLASYDRRGPVCKPLADQLSAYDFSAVRAALVASVPGRHDARARSGPLWGWAALERCLRSVPCKAGDSEVVVQISSMATLGPRDDWLQKTLFDSLARCKAQQPAARPRFKIVFPTADEVRQSLDGYASGGSIHTKTQSRQQASQLEYLRPMLHHWANDCRRGRELPAGSHVLNSGRSRAAPHVKTYMRFSADGSIDWALLSSANLSKQAWGEASKATGEMRIASWEVGVMVWPELYGEGSIMVGAFGSDKASERSGGANGAVVGLRMPYSVPLQRYGQNEVPWVASTDHAEPDCWGRVWEGQSA
ncbi:hypothetical protein XA68_13002 [Ophiocordyceps unilateralis]|uniref:PLD phosphodiesterase domain-containing protein n=1 Tax=Ophiocordyceps unilateralis TaxID=268505 RepID=A0A2A9PNY5_OPHUN|nr:hypothetical protein XA68_13002 [Ophiocordyceps unilateralis]